MKTQTILSFICAAILTPLTLHAQATRTWVSGVGDDANPCSRTAPGKTFAGAISKTAAGGEIDALDPAGFGAVTITKSITIDGGGGQVASILVSGTNGIIINAADTDVIVLRNLRFEGMGTGLNGINIIKAGAVHLENCYINGFATGINFISSSPSAQLFVNECRIHKCTTMGISLSDGVSTGMDSSTKIDGTSVEGCTGGIKLGNGVATITKTSSSGNNSPGFDAAIGTKMTLIGCTSSGNTIGVNATGTVYLTDCVITNNEGAGLQRTGTIYGFKNNVIAGNTPDGKPNKTSPLR